MKHHTSKPPTNGRSKRKQVAQKPSIAHKSGSTLPALRIAAVFLCLAWSSFTWVAISMEAMFLPRPWAAKAAGGASWRLVSMYFYLGPCYGPLMAENKLYIYIYNTFVLGTVCSTETRWLDASLNCCLESSTRHTVLPLAWIGTCACSGHCLICTSRSSLPRSFGSRRFRLRTFEDAFNCFVPPRRWRLWVPRCLMQLFIHWPQNGPCGVYVVRAQLRA